MDDESAALVRELRALAELSQFSGRAADLRSLSDELADDRADTWIGINLVGAFPPGATSEPRGWHFIERWFSYIGTFVIFLPIAWTWFSFRAASATYRDWLQAGRVGQETFLSLWATGFGGELASYHRLTTVALVSLIIIVIAALMVVLQRGLVYRNQKAETAAYARLVAVLIGAQRTLNKRLTDDPNNTMAWVRRTVLDVIDAHAKTQEAAADLRAATSELTAAVADSLKPVLASLEPVASNLTNAATASEAAAHALDQTSAGLRTSVDATLSRFKTELAAELTSFRTESAKLIADAETAHGQVLDRTERAGVQVAEAVDRLSTEHRALSETVKTLPEANRAAAAPLADAVARFEASVGGWDRTLGQHGQDLRSYASAAQHQLSEFTAASDDTRQLLNDFLDRHGSGLTLAGNGRSSGNGSSGNGTGP